MKVLKIDTDILKSKLSRRIFGLFIFCALVPFLTLSAITYILVTNQLYNTALARLQRSSKEKGFEIYEHLLFLETEMKAIISHLENDDIGSFKPLPYDPEKDESSRFISLITLDEQNRKNPILNNIDTLPALTLADRQHLRAGRTLFKVKYMGNRFPAIFLYRTVAPQRPGSTHLVGQVEPAYLWNIGGSSTLPPEIEMVVVQEDKNILLASIPGFEMTKSLRRTFKGSSSSGYFETRFNGDTYVSSYWSLFIKPRFLTDNLIIILSQSKSSIYEPVSNFKNTFLQLMLLTFWIVALLSIMLIKKSLVPIRILQSSTRKIANREFDIQVNIKSGDEFEMLAQSFNEMSKKLKEGQKLLVQAAKMSTMGQMAAGIVHEIGQPLSAIFGFTDLLQSEDLSEDQKKYLDTTRAELERLRHILEKFGSFSRSADYTMEPVSLNRVLDETIKLVEHQFHMKRIHWEFEKADDLPLVMGDLNSLKQVFLNLVINAMDAMESMGEGHEPHLKIKTRVHHDTVTVTMEDNGRGIAEETQKKIFEPFFTTKSTGRGSGLGLAITDSILHRHNAKIELDSEINRGTCFNITFPIPRELAEEGSPENE